MGLTVMTGECTSRFPCYVARVKAGTRSTRHDAVPPGYAGLRERALQLLADEADGLDAAALAQRLFGTGSGDRWAALLPAVLGTEPRLESVDGRWRLRDRRRAAASPTAMPPLHPAVADPNPSLAPLEAPL